MKLWRSRQPKPLNSNQLILSRSPRLIGSMKQQQQSQQHEAQFIPVDTPAVAPHLAAAMVIPTPDVVPTQDVVQYQAPSTAIVAYPANVELLAETARLVTVEVQVEHDKLSSLENSNLTQLKHNTNWNRHSSRQAGAWYKMKELRTLNSSSPLSTWHSNCFGKNAPRRTRPALHCRIILMKLILRWPNRLMRGTGSLNSGCPWAWDWYVFLATTCTSITTPLTSDGTSITTLEQA